MRTVLVVDDDEQMRTFMASALDHLGFRYDTAAGGSEALALLADKDFDIVILDILMPEVDGLEVLRRLSITAPQKPLRIIAMSGGGEKLSGWFAGKLAEAFGATHTLFKPFSIEDLKAALQ